MNCIYCETSLPERAFYCKSCKKQVKCKNCKELLEQNSQACVMCGTNVGEGEINSNGSNNQSQTMNTFEFKETETEKTAKAILTDESVKNLSDTLTSVVTGNRLLNIGRKYEIQKLNSGQDIINSQSDFELNDENETIEIKAKPVSTNDNEIVENLKSIFYKDENKFILEVQDLKSAKQLDFGKRLVYLQLLYSKEVLGEDFVSREIINETLLEVMKVRDSNVVTWITNAGDLYKKTEEGKEYLRLTNGKDGGYKKALEILNEVFDDDKKGTFLPEKKSKATSKSGKTSTKKSTSKTKSHSKTKEVEDWMTKWKELNLGIDLHNIAKKISTLDKIVLGIWVIYKATAKSAVKIDTLTTSKLANFITEQFVIKVTRQSFDQTLKGELKDYVMKMPDGWKITPTGIIHAENLINSSNTTSKTKK